MAMVTVGCATLPPQPVEPYIAALRQLSKVETPTPSLCERPPAPSVESVVWSSGGVLMAFSVQQEGALAKCEVELQAAGAVVRARQHAEADLADKLEGASKSAQIRVSQ